MSELVQSSMFNRGATMSHENQDITAAYSHNNKMSSAANKSVKANKAAQRNKVLQTIIGSQGRGYTCDEIEMLTGMSHQAASARCTELLALDKVVRSGKRKTRSGRYAAVLTLKK